jgi:uncharacterized membrane-anchored protein YhcB (DUF1043 family)
MEKEGALSVLKFPNNEIEMAILVGLILIGIIILALGSTVSESKNRQQEFADKLKDKGDKLKQKEEKLNQIQEQLRAVR